MKVFWSWQDDSPGKTNRHFIKAALEEAVAAIEGDYAAEDADRPELDHDTKGVAGAKEIVPTLMAKIASSAVFVADVTPIGETAKGKALPNPNVMVELGWSLNKPGDGRQIYVLNTTDGWKIEQLPFDIRHRRVLTYTLAETADPKTRERVKKELVKDLTGAIKAIINEHLDEKAQTSGAIGVEAKPDEPSIWKGGENGFAHQDSLGNHHWTKVSVTPGPRAYLRVVPSGWKMRPPDVAAIGNLKTRAAPHSMGRYSSGDFGPTKEGYARYWISSRPDEARTTEDLVMYFEDTGEFWLLMGGCVYSPTGGGQPLVDLASLFKVWSAALRRAHWVLDHFGALAPRRVEIGFTGFAGVRFPGGWESSRPPARRDCLKHEEIRRDWAKPEAQQAFLEEALFRVFALFGVPALTSAEAQRFLADNDHERGSRNPLD
jgi:hypothetical protein